MIILFYSLPNIALLIFSPYTTVLLLSYIIRQSQMWDAGHIIGLPPGQTELARLTYLFLGTKNADTNQM